MANALEAARPGPLRRPRRASGGGLEDDDAGWAGRMLVVVSRIAEQPGLTEDGYRLVLNNGPDAGREVPHIHMHILGGVPLGPIA